MYKIAHFIRKLRYLGGQHAATTLAQADSAELLRNCQVAL
jgi:hypothetical protein